MDPFESFSGQIEAGGMYLGFRETGRIEAITLTAIPAEADRYPDAVLPSLDMGEESSDEYLPGTILIGARTGPDAPWVLSRNQAGEILEDGSNGTLVVRYDFGILEEVEGTGTFEGIVDAAMPTVRWTVKLRNRSRQSLEIGELAFPFALNNVMVPTSRSDEAAADVLNTRFHVHPFAGGAASFLAAFRAIGSPPGLLVVPRGEAGWEFTCSVPASLRTPLCWEGIPVMYVHSRATVEREEWPEWFNGHTSLVLEPGEERTYETDLVMVADPHPTFDVAGVMAKLGRPGIRFRPSAVAPTARGVGFEVTGVRPIRYWTDREGAKMEVDSESDGGQCLVRHPQPGPIRVSFEDENGGVSHVHALLVPDPARTLKRRATKLGKLADPKRRAKDEGAEIAAGTMLEVETALGDAGLLAALSLRTGLASAEGAERTLASLLGRAIDPATLEVSAFIPPEAKTGAAPSHLRPGLLLASALDRLGRTEDDPALRRGAARARARALARADHHVVDAATWLPGAEAASDPGFAEWRAESVLPYRYPLFGEGAVTMSGLSEAMAYAFLTKDGERIKRYCRMALAAKSPAPAWWAYGMDRRIGGPFESPRPECTLPVAADRGSMVPAPWTAAHSAFVLRAMAEGYVFLAEGTQLLLEAGLWGPMALLREDGAATMGVCVDAASMQGGVLPLAGDSSVGLTAMLDAGSAVVDRGPNGLTATGARASLRRDSLMIEPTVPVCREVRAPFLGITARSERAAIARVEIALTREWARIEAVAWTKGDGAKREGADEAIVEVEGLWGLAESGPLGDVGFSRRVRPGADGSLSVEFRAEPPDDPFRRDAPLDRPLRFNRTYPAFREDGTNGTGSEDRGDDPYEPDDDEE